nr:hypothetical protein [Tanacetum cinerariifolium]
MAAVMKHMASSFAKLEKFEGVDFRRGQKKMHFMLSSMSVVYVLATPLPKDGSENPTVEQVKRRAKWDNDNYVCRRLILNAKYMAEDALNKKHMASSFAKLEKFEGVDFKRWQKKMHFMLSSMSVVYVLTTPLPKDGSENPTVEQVKRRAKWDNDNYVCRRLILNDFKHTLKHLKEELTLIELGSNLHIEESLKVQKSHKLKGNNVAGPLVVNMVEHNNNSRLGHVHFKRMQDMSKDGLIPAFNMDTENDLCDLYATPSLGNKKYFVTFIDDAS